MANENMTFKEAFAVLQRHAETLRNQDEPNIDDLLPMVEESVVAYRVCKQRIDAVEKALEKALTDAVEGGLPADVDGISAARRRGQGNQESASPARAAKSSFDEMDDDIPF